MKKFLIIILTILLLLTACSSSKNEIDDPKSRSTETGSSLEVSTPTPNPSPTPSPTPVPEERITIAETSYFEGDYQKSIAELEQAKNTSTDTNIRAISDIGLSQIYIIQTKFTDASKILLPIIENESIKEEIRAKASYFYGVSQENLNNPIVAAQGYTGYNQFSPGKLDSFMYEKAGDVLNQFQYYDEALENYSLAIDQIQSGDSLTIKIKIGKIYAAQADHTNAIRIFMEVYDSSPNEFTRAQMNLLTGQSYLALGMPEQAYARFQDSVQNYPRAFDTHSGLVALVNAGIPVDEFNRGMTNYYAGSYGLAINAFLRYIDQTPDHNGNAYYFIGHAYRRMDEPQNAIFSWEKLINNYPENLFFVDTWKDIAYTQWAFLNQYGNAAQTLLTFAENYPLHDEAPAAVVEAGRIYERNNQLTDAATTWAKLIDLYPQKEISSEALFYSALTNYRLAKYDQSLSQFQRYLLLTSIPAQKASAYFWIAKVYEQLGDLEKSQTSLLEASRQDPTGYYSLRAKEKLSSAPLFSPFSAVDLNVNLDQERLIAEVWMRNTFSLSQDTNFITLVSFSTDPAFIKATAYWDLRLYHLARNEYEILRSTYKDDPVNLFRLTNHFLDIGLYRSAILSSRQILDLANMDDDTSLSAPLWFNHIRFGLFFSDLIDQAALDYNFDPLLIYSLIRQESFFEGFIISSAGAKGLMQIMSATGQEIADILRWPPDYQESDLYRPVINIRMGTSYLSRMRTFFDGDIYAALAAYNAGPGNVLKWIEKANNDPDLFLETIPFEETRRYLRNIYTFYRIYETLYPVRTAE